MIHRGGHEKSLAEMLAPGSKARQRSPKAFAHAVGSAYFDVATAYYQQGREPKKTVDGLALASHYLMEEVALPPSQAGRRPSEFERTLALTVCFGSPEDIAKGLSVSDDLIFTPVNDEALRLYRLSLKYVNLIRQFLSSGSVDLELIAKAQDECQAANSWKSDAIETRAKLRALQAVVQSESALWNESLDILVREHLEESMHGDFQKLNLAFICLPALLLAKLGIDKRMECTVSSPYLPVQLLSDSHG